MFLVASLFVIKGNILLTVIYHHYIFVLLAIVYGNKSTLFATILFHR